MRTFIKFVCLAVVAGLLGAARTAVAQDSTNAAPTTNAAPVTKTAKPRGKAITGAVTKIDNDAKTITIANHDKPFSITSKTKITKAGEPAILSDIMVGDRVTIRAKDDETGNPVATSIRVGKPKVKAEAAAAPATDSK